MGIHSIICHLIFDPRYKIAPYKQKLLFSPGENFRQFSNAWRWREFCRQICLHAMYLSIYPLLPGGYLAQLEKLDLVIWSHYKVWVIGGILAKAFFVMCGSPQTPLLMHFSKRTHFYRMLYTYIQSAFASSYYRALQQHRFQQAICLAPIHEIPTQLASITFRLSNTGTHPRTWYKNFPRVPFVCHPQLPIILGFFQKDGTKRSRGSEH